MIKDYMLVHDTNEDGYVNPSDVITDIVEYE